jgi:formiminoglutamase
MAWTSYYQKADLTLWQGRSDAEAGEYFYQIVNPLDLTSLQKKTPGFALLGFACDEGVRRNHGRIGAAFGPKALKQALARLPILKNFKLYDAGTVTCPNETLEAAQAALGAAVHLLLEHDLHPLVLGGGHETAWGHYQGLQHYLVPPELQIINFDAHFDLRAMQNQQGTSGTPFRQIALARRAAQLDFNYACVGIQKYGTTRTLFETAHNLQVEYLYADDIHVEGAPMVMQFIEKLLAQPAPIYFTLCLDVFAAHDAPGVSAPQVLGLSPQHVLPALKALAASGKVISFDIVELNPKFDVDQCTAKLGAYLLSEFLHHYQPFH